MLGRRRPFEEGDEQQGSPQRRQRIEPIDPFGQTFTNKAELQVALAEADEFYKTKLPPSSWAPAALHRWNQSKIMSRKPFAPLNVSHIIETWDTSGVKDFSNLFYGFWENGSDFFEGITNWNTANVKNLDACFARCYNFNAPLAWDTSNVTSMDNCFFGCTRFNQLLKWNTSNVTSLFACFSSCTIFNQAINWNMLKVTHMGVFLDRCGNFNNGGERIVWNLPRVTNLSSMFRGCSHLNVPVTLLRLNNITNVSDMLYECVQFKSELIMDASSALRLAVRRMLWYTAVDANEKAMGEMQADCERNGILFIPDADDATGSELVQFLNVYNSYVDPQFGRDYRETIE